MSQMTYEAEGSVRGGCGHQHRTIAGAVRCMERDASACASLGGGAYSDRRVIRRSDGEILREYCAWDERSGLGEPEWLTEEEIVEAEAEETERLGR